MMQNDVISHDKISVCIPIETTPKTVVIQCCIYDFSILALQLEYNRIGNNNLQKIEVHCETIDLLFLVFTKSIETDSSNSKQSINVELRLSVNMKMKMYLQGAQSAAHSRETYHADLNLCNVLEDDFNQRLKKNKDVKA